MKEKMKGGTLLQDTDANVTVRVYWRVEIWISDFIWESGKGIENVPFG